MKRKLDTPEEIDRVCFLYYRSSCNDSQIARHFDVSPITVSRVLKENGVAYLEREKIETPYMPPHGRYRKPDRIRAQRID